MDILWHVCNRCNSLLQLQQLASTVLHSRNCHRCQNLYPLRQLSHDQAEPRRRGAVSRRSVRRRAARRAEAWHVPGAPLCRRRGPGPGFRLGPGHPLPAGQALRAKSSCAALLAGAAAAASGRWQIFGAAGG